MPENPTKLCPVCGAPLLPKRMFCSRRCAGIASPKHQGPRRKRPIEKRFHEKTDASGGPDACWEWTAARDTRNYGVLQVSGRALGAHRVSWELTNGPIPEGLFVCHKCDNPGCVNPSHLFLGTPADNMHDAIDKGRIHKVAGERHGNAKLLDQDIPDILAMLASGMSLAAVANHYRISRTTVCNIKNRKQWAHVLPLSQEV